MIVIADVRGKEDFMRIRADVKCHSCGFVSGELVGSVDAQKRVRPESITPSMANTMQPWPKQGEPLRCVRCTGKTYLDEIDVLRDVTMVMDAPAKAA